MLLLVLKIRIKARRLQNKSLNNRPVFDLFKVHNISKTKTLTFNDVVATVQTDRLDENKPSFIVPIGAKRIVEDIYLGRKITLQPGDSEEITISVDISDNMSELSRQFINGFFVEGFVRLKKLKLRTMRYYRLPSIGFCKSDKAGHKVKFYDTSVLEKSIYE